MLAANRSDSIIGDQDPAEGSVLAHTSAWALMGVSDEDFGPEAVERLIETVKCEGTDIIAALWSRSPEFTLPGVLWRLYLLSEWYRKDPDEVEQRFREGILADVIPGLEHPVTVIGLETVMDNVNALLTGQRTDDDLASIISMASRLMRVLAAGDTYGMRWINDERNELAYPLTIRSEALVKTAEELDRAEQYAQSGSLD